MKKSKKKFVLVGLVLLAVTGLLVLAGCDTTLEPESPQMEQTVNTDNNGSTVNGDNPSTGGDASDGDNTSSDGNPSTAGNNGSSEDSDGESNSNTGDDSTDNKTDASGNENVPHKHDFSYAINEDTHTGKCICGAIVGVIDGTLGGKTTATEDEVNALVEKLKKYVDNGITTIIVTGETPAMYDSVMGTIPAYAEALYLLTDLNEDSPYCGTIDLILPDATEIVDFSFDSADALKSITLPKVTTVGDGAFYGCTYLRTITFGSVVTTIIQNERVTFHMVGNDVGGCDLVLNCGQAGENSPYIPDFTANTWYDAYNEFKSITLTHTGECDECKANQ